MFKQNGGKTAKKKLSTVFLRTFDFQSVKNKEKKSPTKNNRDWLNVL